MSTLELTGLAPRTLGQYKLVRETGRGGMSIVYEAVDTRLGRIVALKVMHAPVSPLIGEGEMVARMRREARAVASLSHPNVVTIYDVGEEGDLHYIATEFLDGVTLRERLNHDPLMPHEAADILRQIADGLDAVHRQGILHRDIKSSNIMLLYNGRVKLLDFGVARFTNDSTLTQIGSMVGSPSYMAPELLTGGKAAPASDIWALGVLLFEMLSNRLPFEADSVASVMYRVMHDSPDALPNVSPEITAVLNQALSKSLPERFPTARALAEAFGNVVAAQPAFEDSEPKIVRESAIPSSILQEEISRVPPQEPTLLASAPVMTEAHERTLIAPTIIEAKAQKPFPVRKQTASPRRTRLLPAVLAFTAIWTAAVAAYTLRSPSSKSAQQTIPTLAAKRPAAAMKSVFVSKPAPVAKITDPNTEGRTNRSSLSTTQSKITRNTAVRKPTPRVSASQMALAEKVEERNNRRASSAPVRVVRREETPVSSRPRVHEIEQPQRSQERKQQNANRLEMADERTSEPQNRVGNAELGTEETSGARTDLSQRLDGWIAATNARDIGEQMRYYSPSLSAFYLKRGVSTQAVRAEKARLFARASDVDIRAGKPQIKLSPDGNMATMRFHKQYNIANGSRTKRGAVLQELRWKRDGEDWKIVSERDLRVLRN